MKDSELIACLLLAEKNNKILIKNHYDKSTGTTTILEVNVVNNHKCSRIGQGRNNKHVRQCIKDNNFGLKNAHEKKERNIEQVKIWNMYVKDVKVKVIGAVPIVPLAIVFIYTM